MVAVSYPNFVYVGAATFDAQLCGVKSLQSQGVSSCKSSIFINEMSLIPACAKARSTIFRYLRACSSVVASRLISVLLREPKLRLRDGLCNDIFRRFCGIDSQCRPNRSGYEKERCARFVDVFLVAL